MVVNSTSSKKTQKWKKPQSKVLNCSISRALLLNRNPRCKQNQVQKLKIQTTQLRVQTLWNSMTTSKMTLNRSEALSLSPCNSSSLCNKNKRKVSLVVCSQDSAHHQHHRGNPNSSNSQASSVSLISNSSFQGLTPSDNLNNKFKVVASLVRLKSNLNNR